MATTNAFDLLGDNDNDDPSQLIAAAQQQKIAAAAKKPAASVAAAAAPAAKLPSKPLPPAQAVREARRNTAPARGGGAGRGGPGRGRGGRGDWTRPNRDLADGNGNGFTGGYASGGGGSGGEEVDGGRPLVRDRGGERERGGYNGPRQSFRGGRRGGYGNGEAGDGSNRLPRRMYERHSGTGRGYEMKREGAGRGNWGTPTDEVLTQGETEEIVNVDEKVVSPEKKTEQEDAPASEGNKDNKEGAANEEEKEPEDKEMTLDEFEKIREEKRKALLSMKAEERKVELDKELKSMQQLSLKKANDEVFIKLGFDKDKGKRKDNADMEERGKKSVSINEFLKPPEGERYYGGRGRGRGRGDRGPFRGGYGGGGTNATAAPSIEDPGQFPTLGGK